MSGKEVLRSSAVPGGIREVKVELVKPRRNTHGPDTVLSTLEDNRGIAKISSRSTDYVYVNSAYVGSVNSVASGYRVSEEHSCSPPTDVYREQYWACSKWPYGQKILALLVGVLLGTVIGLSITFALKGVSPDDVIGGIFRTSPAITPAME